MTQAQIERILRLLCAAAGSDYTPDIYPLRHAAADAMRELDPTFSVPEPGNARAWLAESVRAAD